MVLSDKPGDMRARRRRRALRGAQRQPLPQDTPIGLSRQRAAATRR